MRLVGDATITFRDETSISLTPTITSNYAPKRARYFADYQKEQIDKSMGK